MFTAMRRKALLGCVFGALWLAGCTSVLEKPEQPSPAPVAATTKPKPPSAAPIAKPKPRVVPRPAPAPKQAPATSSRSELPAMIGGAKWVDYGRSLVVDQGNPAARQPVPLFKQAGVLAAVRANLADSPAKPRAEFRRGLLTLTFDRGSNAEIAEAVRRATNNAETGVLGIYISP